jgi:hypothetical protein
VSINAGLMRIASAVTLRASDKRLFGLHISRMLVSGTERKAITSAIKLTAEIGLRRLIRNFDRR